MRAMVVAAVAGIGLGVWNGIAADSVLPADAEKNAMMYRGITGSGSYGAVGLPTEWSEKDGKNILWKAKLDPQGWAAPLVWGNKAIAVGATAEKRMIWCFDAATGKMLWKKQVDDIEGTTKELALDTMDERWNKLLHAGATPVTDGKNVYVLFSNGQLVAADLATGKVAWTIALGDTSSNKYGLDCSLLLYKDSVIAAFEGDKRWIAAYAVADGIERWKTDRKNSTWGSPILIKTPAGKDLVVLLADPDLTAWDPATGKEVWTLDILEKSPQYCVGPSAIYGGGLVFVNSENAGIYAVNPDTGKKVWGTTELPDEAGFSDGVSMVTDGKHVYQFFKDVLSCLDAKTGKVVKQKAMDITGGYGSPILADGRLFLFGAGGEALVVSPDPAKDFEVIGKGRVGDSCDPVLSVVPGRFYMRTDEALYCIGAK